MRRNNKKFSVGKLKHNFLNKMLSNFVTDLEMDDKRIILGSKIGEDAAVIDMGDKYLVAKTDPITFVVDEIGYYVVIVNVNDVVCTGATPKWFQSTILLPEKNTSAELIEKIFKDIHDTCKSMQISVIGGHTEVTANLDRPIVIGSLLGEVDKEKFITTSGAQPGDALVLTKGIFIEGTSIIGREKEEFLMNTGYTPEFIKRCKNYLYDPGISVFKEAFLANKKYKINSMHDPTEGGLNTAIAEMAIAANLGIIIESKKIKILPEPLELSKIFNLNPLGTISSGSLLISIEDKFSEDLVEFLRSNDITTDIIGYFTEDSDKYLIKDKGNKLIPLIYSEKDEITKIF